MKDICNFYILEYDQAQPQSGKIVSKKFKTCKYRERIFKIGKWVCQINHSYFIPNLETSQYFFSMVSIEPELDVTKQNDIRPLQSYNLFVFKLQQYGEKSVDAYGRHCQQRHST